MRRFRFVEHTGDVGVMVYGDSLAGLFTHAAEALFHVMTEPRKIRDKESRNISLKASGPEALLVTWLNEFLYLFDTEMLLFRQFEIRELNGIELIATARGETYQEGRHPINTVVKAVTYHQLKISNEKGVWKTRIIFDL